MSVSEWTVRSWEVNIEAQIYIHISTWRRGETDTLRETKWEIDNSRKQRQSCVSDGVNDFVNDISRRVTFGAFNGECRIKARSLPLQREETPPSSVTHATTKQRRTDKTHGDTAWQRDPTESSSMLLLEKWTEVHLGFVALLSTQSRSRSVELLGYDTQELGLVLCSVAVRRADVHHLERDRDTDTGRYTEERGTERQSECQEELEITAEKTKSRRERVAERAEIPNYEERFFSCVVGGGECRGWGWGGGQPAVTHTAVDSTRSIFYLWEQQNNCGSAAAGNSAPIIAVQHAVELSGKAEGSRGS